MNRKTRGMWLTGWKMLIGLGVAGIMLGQEVRIRQINLQNTRGTGMTVGGGTGVLCPAQQPDSCYTVGHSTALDVLGSMDFPYIGGTETWGWTNLTVLQWNGWATAIDVENSLGFSPVFVVEVLQAGNQVIVGGLGGLNPSQAYLASLDAGSGSLQWFVLLDTAVIQFGTVNGLAWDGTSLYVSGRSDTLGWIARVDPADGTIQEVVRFTPATYMVEGMTFRNGRLYLAGYIFVSGAGLKGVVCALRVNPFSVDGCVEITSQDSTLPEVILMDVLVDDNGGIYSAGNLRGGGQFASFLMKLSSISGNVEYALSYTPFDFLRPRMRMMMMGGPSLLVIPGETGINTGGYVSVDPTTGKGVTSGGTPPCSWEVPVSTQSFSLSLQSYTLAPVDVTSYLTGGGFVNTVSSHYRNAFAIQQVQPCFSCDSVMALSLNMTGQSGDTVMVNVSYAGCDTCILDWGDGTLTACTDSVHVYTSGGSFAITATCSPQFPDCYLLQQSVNVLITGLDIRTGERVAFSLTWSPLLRTLEVRVDPTLVGSTLYLYDILGQEVAVIRITGPYQRVVLPERAGLVEGAFLIAEIPEAGIRSRVRLTAY